MEKRHMMFSEAAELGAKAQPARMWLTHYSPSLIKPDEYMEETRKIFDRVEAGKDLMSIDLKFDDEENAENGTDSHIIN